jgi:hypothetical protein
MVSGIGASTSLSGASASFFQPVRKTKTAEPAIGDIDAGDGRERG